MGKISSWLPIVFLGGMGAALLLLLNGASGENLLASGVLLLLSIVFGGWAELRNTELMKIAGDECQEITGWFSDANR